MTKLRQHNSKVCLLGDYFCMDYSLLTKSHAQSQSLHLVEYYMDLLLCFQVKVLVPNSTAGMIIGKSGNFIKQIKEESGAYVQLSQKSKETNLPERCVTIAGKCGIVPVQVLVYVVW